MNSTFSLERLYKSSQMLDSGKPADFVRDPSQAPGQSFTETMGEMGKAALSSLGQAEQTAMAGMAGKADPHAIVEALAAAELALETAVSVRDKAVEAYQEILRMPV
jgi:flagellar hook-basal body complex protein FliE